MMNPEPPPQQFSNYPRLEGPTGPTCPDCRSTNTTEVKYTWWGGLVGPRMMNLTKCNSCSTSFNRVTGKSAQKAILAYNLVSFGIVLVIVVAFMIFRG